MGERIVIVGAGDCGARAASTLRGGGHDGPITLVGAEARAPYERPPLSKSALTGAAEPIPKTGVGAGRLVELQIEFRCGVGATAIDRKSRTVTLATGETLVYDRLLLATGARPRQFRLEGAEHPAIMHLRTFEDALRLRAALIPGRQIVIIGGGFIGLEVAASAHGRGADVTVIEALPRLLSRAVPAEIAAVIEHRHRAEGVDIRCPENVQGFGDRGGRVEVRLASGSTIAADLVLVAIGVVPDTALAAAAALEIDNGIAVDDRLRTTDPAIFAAGDCCSLELPIYGGRRVRLESWRCALDLGGHAARNMLGADEAVGIVPWFWSDQYDFELQIAGLCDEGSTTVRRDLGAGAFVLFHLDAVGRLVAASGVGPEGAVARDIRLAEMLIDRRAHPEPRQLALPQVRLKSLLTS